MTVVGPALRRAIREEAPAGRDTLVATVAARTGTDRVTVREAVDELEREGEVYCVPRETGSPMVKAVTREVV